MQRLQMFQRQTSGEAESVEITGTLVSAVNVSWTESVQHRSTSATMPTYGDTCQRIREMSVALTDGKKVHPRSAFLDDEYFEFVVQSPPIAEESLTVFHQVVERMVENLENTPFTR